MSQTITITIEDDDYKAMEFIAVSVQTWSENFINVRARKAKKEIISKLIEHCNANSIAMATGEAAQINQAYDLNIVDTAANVRAAQLAASSDD